MLTWFLFPLIFPFQPPTFKPSINDYNATTPGLQYTKGPEPICAVKNLSLKFAQKLVVRIKKIRIPISRLGWTIQGIGCQRESFQDFHGAK